MGATDAPRNTPAPDGRRWRAHDEAALLCPRCGGAHAGRPGVTWLGERWVVDWVCPKCGTAASREATDTEIWAWSDTIGPWTVTPRAGGSEDLLA